MPGELLKQFPSVIGQGR